MAARYPQGVFQFETIDARSALARQWGINIPTNVTNEDILQAGLLSSDIRPQPGFGFEDTLLSQFYAPIFTSKTFPFTQLPSLLEAVDPQKWKANLGIPLLARTLHARLEEWKSKTRSSEQRQLVELFAADPHALKLQLMRFRVLQRYPTIGEALLGEAFDVFRTLKLQLEDLKVEESKIPETILQVTYFLNNQQPQNLDDLVTLLDRTSGLLSVEFEAIEKHLRIIRLDHSGADGSNPGKIQRSVSLAHPKNSDLAWVDPSTQARNSRYKLGCGDHAFLGDRILPALPILV